MPLHRDIHWIGRQWAVTGHGLQLIDQKQQGLFDIGVSDLWDDALVDALRALDWLNAPDFEKAITVARARHQPPPEVVARLREVAAAPANEPVAPPPPAAELEAVETAIAEKPGAVEPPRIADEMQGPAVAVPVATRPPGPPPTLFQMRYEGRARFVRPWRVLIKWKIQGNPAGLPRQP